MYSLWKGLGLGFSKQKFCDACAKLADCNAKPVPLDFYNYIVKDCNLLVSRYELGELNRLMGDPDVRCLTGIIRRKVSQAPQFSDEFYGLLGVSAMDEIFRKGLKGKDPDELTNNVLQYFAGISDEEKTLVSQLFKSDCVHLVYWLLDRARWRHPKDQRRKGRGRARKNVCASGFTYAGSDYEHKEDHDSLQFSDNGLLRKLTSRLRSVEAQGFDDQTFEQWASEILSKQAKSSNDQSLEQFVTDFETWLVESHVLPEASDHQKDK